MVDHPQTFQERETLIMLVAPKGRAKRSYWMTGFYRIAKARTSHRPRLSGLSRKVSEGSARPWIPPAIWKRIAPIKAFYCWLRKHPCQLGNAATGPSGHLTAGSAYVCAHGGKSGNENKPDRARHSL